MDKRVSITLFTHNGEPNLNSEDDDTEKNVSNKKCIKKKTKTKHPPHVNITLTV